MGLDYDVFWSTSPRFGQQNDKTKGTVIIRLVSQLDKYLAAKETFMLIFLL